MRVIALVALAWLATWWAVRGCTPERPPVGSPPAAAREAFDTLKPLRLELLATPDANGKRADVAWLELELRYLLTRARVQVAPIGSRASRPVSRDSRETEEAAPASDPFVLRVALAADAAQASVALIAADQVLEREHTFAIGNATRLGIAREFAMQLPAFLRVPAPTPGWSALPFVSDASSYETFTHALSELLGPEGRGFTRSPLASSRARPIERLEALIRSQPRFARAQALLAIGYLSLGGEDDASLTQLAESNAERAIALDAHLAEAHSALGLVAARRNEWSAARKQFDAALTLDPNSAPALEGLACLLADAGRYAAARLIAARAVAVQPRSIGANQCLACVAMDSTAWSASDKSGGAADVQVFALKAILAGNVPAAEHALRSALHPRRLPLWAQAVLRAARDRRHIPDALRAVTRAANERRIDASTEILCGAALKQAEFVFNRMMRLRRQRAPAPLRILWLRDTAFLRQHARFKDVIDAAGLPAFWQEHGAPDLCASEPETYGCKVPTRNK